MPGFFASVVRSITMTPLPREEEERAEERNARKSASANVSRAVIATAELNRKRTRARTKGDERCEKEENEQEKEAGRDRPANQTLLDFPSPPCIPPTTRKGGCSCRTACRLTRHIITPLLLVSPIHPSSSVPLTASSYLCCPSRPPPPLIPVSSPFHLLQ